MKRQIRRKPKVLISPGRRVKAFLRLTWNTLAIIGLIVVIEFFSRTF